MIDKACFEASWGEATNDIGQEYGYIPCGLACHPKTTVERIV